MNKKLYIRAFENKINISIMRIEEINNKKEKYGL